MKIKVLTVSVMAVAVMGFGILLGSMVGAGGAAAQTPSVTTTAPSTQSSGTTTTTTTAPPAQTSGDNTQPAQTTTTKVTKDQAEKAALAAAPGSTIDHTILSKDANGTAFWDVDFTNGGGVTVNADTGAIIATEAAGTDNHAGGKGGHMGGADQAALAAQAKITKDQAEKTALTAAPGSTIEHSRLGKDANGTIFWDVDFTNGGGVTVNADTGAVIATEAAGTDHPDGGRPGGRGGHDAPPAAQP